MKPTFIKVYGPPFDYQKQEQRMMCFAAPSSQIVELYSLMKRVLDIVELNLYRNCREAKKGKA